MTSALTALQITQLNKMNRAAQNAALGTRLNALEIGEPGESNIIKYSTTPALGTATATKAAYTLGAAPVAGVTAGITQPDVPRALSIKGNASMSGNVVIHGTNFADAIVSDTIALNNSSEVLGIVAFKTVTSIDFPAKTNGSGDTVSIGRSNRIGLPVAVTDATFVIVKSFNNAPDAGSVTVDATVGKSVYTPAGTLNGLKVLLLYVMP